MVKGVTMHGVRAQGDHHVEVAEHWETKDGVDSDVGAESERKCDSGAG